MLCVVQRIFMKQITQLLALVSLCVALPAQAGDVKFNEAAPAMLPILLSDGSRVNLEDCAGKVVVFYFYEQQCPTCREKVPQRNAWLETYKGKPVRFIAVGAGDSAAEVQQYAASAKLALPVTPDPVSLLERSWGFSISLKNIYQTRVVRADGTMGGFTVGNDFFDKALDGAKWKYEREGYDPAFLPVMDAFDWGDLDNGVKMLKQAKRAKKNISESAAKFLDVLKVEYQASFDEAVPQIESDPVQAFDRLSKVSLVMNGEPLGKLADEKLKSLRSNETVKNELAARKMLDQLSVVSIKAKKGQEGELGAFAQSIIKKYPETPTAKRVEKIVAAWQ